MIGQFLILLGSRGFGSLLQAATAIMLARLGGPADFGTVAVWTSASVVALAIADWGMSSYLSRARAKGDVEGLSDGLRFNACGSAVCAVLALSVLAMTRLVGMDVPWVLSALVVGQVLDKNVDTRLVVAIAEGRQWAAAASVISRRATTLLTFVAILAMGGSPLAGYCVGLLAGGLAGLLHSRLVVRAPTGFTMSLARMRRVAGQAFPFFVSNASVQLRNLDVPIVSHFLSVQSAGLYSAAQRLVNPLLLIPGSLAALVLPHASRGTDRAALLLMRKMMIGSLLAVVCVGIGLPWADDILRGVLGGDFAGATGAFAWMLLGFPFVALASPQGSVLQGRGKESFVALNGLITSLATVTGVVVGASLGGVTEAALAVSLSFLVKSVSLHVHAEIHLRDVGGPVAVETSVLESRSDR